MFLMNYKFYLCVNELVQISAERKLSHLVNESNRLINIVIFRAIC